MSDIGIERELRVLQGYDLLLDVPEEDRVGFIRERFGADPSLARELERLVEAAAAAEGGILMQGAQKYLAPVVEDLDERSVEEKADIPSQLTEALAPRYSIENKIGSGGMAIVYLAFDNQLHRSVAIKVLRPELADAPTMERFEREIATAARLNHPRIVAVHDRGPAAGTMYYIMRHVPGGSLRDFLDESKPLEIPEAISIARQVAEALDYAHANHVIHRDIKPENILLDDNGAYVADFGVARILDAAGRERLSRTGMAIGTVLYMSPEQIESSPTLDGRSDVYALACVMYEMLAGEPPYTGSNQQDVLRKHLGAAIPDLCVVRSTITRKMQNAIATGLEKRPVDRFAKANLLVNAFERAYEAAREESAEMAQHEQRQRTIAVLPFTNMSGDPENEYFSDGITEELITALTRAGGMRVIARTSIIVFKGQQRDIREIGIILGATHILEGSVRMAGRRLRASARLVDATSGHPLWSERFDRDLEDVFAVQDEITNAIAVRLRQDMEGPDEPMTGSPLAMADDEPETEAPQPQDIISDRAWGTRRLAEADDSHPDESASAVSAPGAPQGTTSVTPILGPRYQVDSVIGAGGLCTVYRARDMERNAVVAIKVAPAATPAVGERMLRGAEVIARLMHPNIVPVLDAGVINGSAYVVMPVGGQSLRQLLHRERQLEVSKAIRILNDVGRALSHAHESGVVHGDVKPENIIVLDDGRAMLTDFLVQAESEAEEEDSIVRGTPAYMSPEQASGERGGPASDQYMLGVVGYEMLTGAVPFVRRGMREEPRDIRLLRPTVPIGAAKAIQKMLATDISGRFASVQAGTAAFAAELITQTGSFVAEADSELFENMTTEQRTVVASRAWKRRRRPDADEPPQMARTTWSPSWMMRVVEAMRSLFHRPVKAPRHKVGPAIPTPLTREAKTATEQRVLLRNFPAYDAYLRGRYLLNFESGPDSLLKAISQFDVAIRDNPGFESAYAARAYARTMLALVGVSPSSELHEHAKEDTDRALSLAPSLAEAHVARALVAMFFKWERATAIAALDYAAEASPAYADAHLWRGFAYSWLEGKPQLAIETLERTLDLDPLSLNARVELAFAYWMEGDLDQAWRQADDAVAAGRLVAGPYADKTSERKRSNGFAAAHYARAVVLADLGRLQESIAEAREACRVGGRQTMHLGFLGRALALTGDDAAAREIIQELKERGRGGAPVATASALVFTGIGNTEKALARLNGAYVGREVNLIFTLYSPHFAHLRSYPRYGKSFSIAPPFPELDQVF
ncbi:MAG: protein kinase [Gemmatimonadaceae bacterium]